MESRNSRRKFLGVVGAATSGAVVLGAAGAPAADEKARKLAGKTFTGTSQKGSFQGALDLAVQAALKSAPGADRMVEWTFRGATGTQGGIAGRSVLTVTIEARIA